VTKQKGFGVEWGGGGGGTRGFPGDWKDLRYHISLDLLSTTVLIPGKCASKVIVTELMEHSRVTDIALLLLLILIIELGTVFLSRQEGAQVRVETCPPACSPVFKNLHCSML